MQQNLKTCIIATDVGTCVIGIESVRCIVQTETATCRIDYRNFHLQKWCPSEILLLIIRKLSEWVSTKFNANTLVKKLDSALSQRVVPYTHYFNFQFSYLHTIYKTNNITRNTSLKVNLIFKVSSIKRQINIPVWTHMGHKRWRNDGKTFTRCYTVALKFID